MPRARDQPAGRGHGGGRPLGLRRDEGGKAQAAWQRELGSVRIEGGSNDDRTVFYTALYHALLQPMTGNDADGRYRGYDNVHTAKDWTYYEYFSLWDTYRAQNQLLALLRPQRARDIANSVLKIREQGGWLPRWGYANFETNVMTGDPVTPFLVDLWRFGALKGREREAYDRAAPECLRRAAVQCRARRAVRATPATCARASCSTTAPSWPRAWTPIRTTAPRRPWNMRWPTAHWRRWPGRSARKTTR
jgi:putative alpha-1,2-mannosidase